MLKLRAISVALTCLMSLLLAGCGGSSDVKPIANLVPCQGTVTLDGKPLEQGTIFFAPVDEKTGQSAVGAIKAGNFDVSTTVSAPGVVAGKYKVRIDSYEIVQLKPGEMSTTLPPSLIPARYNNIATSGLEVEVAKGMPPIKLELTK